MKTLMLILAMLCCLICVPEAQAGPLCRLFGGCGAANVQADYPVQKGPRRERAWRLFQRWRR